MGQSLKAALLSAFAFPGSGHFILKKKLRGTLLAVVTIGCLWVLLSTALEKAREISLRIQSGEIPIDLARLTEEASKLASGNGTQQAEIATYLLLFCWLVGIIDAYRLGRLEDKAGSSREKQTR